jgi:hypothetical protein
MLKLKTEKRSLQPCLFLFLALPSKLKQKTKMAKKVPNPDGKKGGKDHQEKIAMACTNTLRYEIATN